MNTAAIKNRFKSDWPLLCILLGLPLYFCNFHSATLADIFKIIKTLYFPTFSALYFFRIPRSGLKISNLGKNFAFLAALETLRQMGVFLTHDSFYINGAAITSWYILGSNLLFSFIVFFSLFWLYNRNKKQNIASWLILLAILIPAILTAIGCEDECLLIGFPSTIFILPIIFLSAVSAIELSKRHLKTGLGVSALAALSGLISQLINVNIEGTSKDVGWFLMLAPPTFLALWLLAALLTLLLFYFKTKKLKKRRKELVN